MSERQTPTCPILGCENHQCEPLRTIYVCDDHAPQIVPGEPFRDWIIRLQEEHAAMRAAIREALEDWDRRDELSAIDGLRAALASRPAPEEPEKAAWEVYRDRWLAKGFNICAYHGFKPGPLPGCNAMYGDIQCSSSADEHCQCGRGDHQAPEEPAP